MQRVVRLNRIDSVFSTLQYPTTPSQVAADCEGVVVELSEGSVDLAETVRSSDADEFSSADDLGLEFMSLLPRHAVGEPYQSEGDA
jgi:hypothetical protein